MAAAQVCQVCESPLKIEFIPDEEEATSSSLQVPDDVMLLACQHHFHWQCLLDSFNNACPSCNVDVTTTGLQEPQILVNIENEGGISERQDVYSVLAEEQYLRHAPQERKARAFLEFCKEGDVDAVMDMLLQHNEDDDDEDMMEDDEEEGEVPQMPLDAVLKYQDPLNGGMSALQAAVLANSASIAWLLLWAASNLDKSHFPPEGIAHVEAYGIQRGLTDVDIRALRDGKGRSAEDIAKELGAPQWIHFIGNQRLET